MDNLMSSTWIIKELYNEFNVKHSLTMKRIHCNDFDG